MKTLNTNSPLNKRGGGGYNLSLNAPTESIHSYTTPTCHTESHTDLTPCHTDLALSHTEPLSCHTDLERSEREVSSSQIQNTFSTTSAKRKKVYPLSAPLNPKKNKATAFSFLQSRGEPRYSASSIKSAGDTTAPFESDFMHHEAGESRNERKAFNIDSMDCHATAAAVSRNDSISNAYTSTNTTHTEPLPCHTDLALSHTEPLSCHTDLERSEREVSSSQIQNTFSTTSAKRKKVYPLSAPLNPKKNKATAFSFCNQGESLAIPLLA